MSLGLRIRLSLMMFLEFFAWGAWYPVLSGYVGKTLGFDSLQVGHIYGLLALASIFMPLLAGQITDRLVPNQIFLGVVHLIGAAGVLFAATQTEFGRLQTGILIWAFAY